MGSQLNNGFGSQKGLRVLDFTTVLGLLKSTGDFRDHKVCCELEGGCEPLETGSRTLQLQSDMFACQANGSRFVIHHTDCWFGRICNHRGDTSLGCQRGVFWIGLVWVGKSTLTSRLSEKEKWS